VEERGNGYREKVGNCGNSGKFNRSSNRVDLPGLEREKKVRAGSNSGVKRAKRGRRSFTRNYEKGFLSREEEEEGHQKWALYCVPSSGNDA